MINYDIVNLGTAAKSFVESDVFKTVIDALKKDACENWIKTPTEAKDAREDLYFLQVALATIEARLQGMIASGRIEASKEVANTSQPI